MRIFADENVPALAVAGLRAAGHDVAWGVEFDHGASDAVRLAFAWRETRIVLTEDQDFADLVVSGRHKAHGLVRFRLPGLGREAKAARIEAGLGEIDPTGKLVVIEPSRIRVRDLRTRGGSP